MSARILLLWACLVFTFVSHAAGPAMRLDEQEVPLSFASLGEASLYRAAKDRSFEGYRFCWQPLKGDSVILRVIRRVDGTALLSKQSYSGDLFANNAIRLGKPGFRVISAAQFSLFRAYLRVADFWRIPVLPKSVGNQWTLEGAQQGNYRWLTMGAPKDMYFIDAALYLVRLAGLEPAGFLVKDPKSNWIHG